MLTQFCVTRHLDLLKGVRYRNETVYGTLSYASMAGGMEIYLDGSGMDEQAHLNNVLFQSHDTPDLEVTGHAADTDDQIQSSTTVGRLAYTLPSLPDLFETDTMDGFSKHYHTTNSESIGFYLHVENEADE